MQILRMAVSNGLVKIMRTGSKGVNLTLPLDSRRLRSSAAYHQLCFFYCHEHL